MYKRADIEKLAEDFDSCRKVLIALGDENASFPSGGISSSSNFERSRNPKSQEKGNKKLLLF